MTTDSTPPFTGLDVYGPQAAMRNNQEAREFAAALFADDGESWTSKIRSLAAMFPEHLPREIVVMMWADALLQAAEQFAEVNQLSVRHSEHAAKCMGTRV